MLWEHIPEQKNEFILIYRDPFCHILRALTILTKLHQKCAAKLEKNVPRHFRKLLVNFQNTRRLFL